MTRKEEIQVSREKYNKREGHDSILKFSLFDVNSAYDEGAEWADSHPQKGKVDIEAVLSWLASHINDYIVKGRDIDYMFDDLRKAMEG